MAHPITPNHMKSPELAAAAINASYGRTVVDKWGILDSGLAEKQINAAVTGTKPFRNPGPLNRGILDPSWSPDGLATAMGLTVSR